MIFIEKWKARADKFAFGIEWIGIVCFLIMVAITTIDVIGTKVFLMPVPGTQDIMMYAQLIAMSFAIGAALLLGRHIQVEFFMQMFPAKIREICEVIVNLFGFVLFVMLAWRLFIYGLQLMDASEVSSTIQLPLFPVAIAVAFACVPVCLMYLLSLITSIFKVFNK